MTASDAEPVATTTTPAPVISYQDQSTPPASVTGGMVQANRHAIPLTILAVALIAAITAMVLTNHDVPSVFSDAMIGVCFALAGITVPPRAA